MVSLKVTFSGETRRAQISDAITYQELVQTIVSLFPNIDEKLGPQLKLVYKDSDGDIVSVSSDEEVATAISQLPSNEAWRVTARAPSSSSGRSHPLVDFLDLLVNPFSLHSELEELIKEREKPSADQASKEEEKSEATETAKDGEETTDGEGEKEKVTTTAEGETASAEDEEDKVKSKPKNGSTQPPVLSRIHIHLAPNYYRRPLFLRSSPFWGPSLVGSNCFVF